VMAHRPAGRVGAMVAALLAAWLAPGLARQARPVYVPETDPLVVQKLDTWQDLKLGLLMHWGTYSEWGIVESWSLCAEDEDWCRRTGPYANDYDAYKRAYEGLQTTFNPVKFDPERWARVAKDAGMRYVVFTTKHHDGFSMFDTKQTDYRITSPKTPFSANPRADVTKAIFDAFRAQGMMAGAYFSKADWHSPDYWWPHFATPDRNPNYNIKEYPDRWARFVAFTHAQIDELMSNYGRVDILWLDAGWVRPLTDAEVKAAVNAPDYKFTHIQSQDIDMPRLVADARAKQPGLIVVDRDVPGPYQDYLTPEAKVPDAPLPYPWEVPMPMARSWSYVPNDVYKPAHQLIQMLVDVVAKGGNLLLNIGPGPDGAWHDAAYDRLAALGAWMKVNSEAIYATRPVAPYAEGKWRFTRAKDGTTFALYLADVAEPLPRTLTIAGMAPADGAAVTLLGPARAIAWTRAGAGVTLQLPADVTAPNADAWVFRISKTDR
jgi:alpha-L-fucosidase